MGVLNIDSTTEILPLGHIAIIRNVDKCYSRPWLDNGCDMVSNMLLRELRQLRSKWTVTALRDMVINFFIRRFESSGSERKVHGADIAIYNMSWLDSDRQGVRFLPPHQFISVTTFYEGGVHEWKFYIIGTKPIIINLENNCFHMVQVTNEMDNAIKNYGQGYKKATVEEICNRYNFDSGETALRSYMRSNLTPEGTQNPDNRTAG